MKNKSCFSVAALLLSACFLFFASPLMADMASPDIVAQSHNTAMPDLLDNDVAGVFATQSNVASDFETTENTANISPEAFTVIWYQPVEFPHGRAEHDKQNMVANLKNIQPSDTRFREVDRRFIYSDS